jgi:hypothetical protein
VVLWLHQIPYFSSLAKKRRGKKRTCEFVAKPYFLNLVLAQAATLIILFMVVMILSRQVMIA